MENERKQANVGVRARCALGLIALIGCGLPAQAQQAASPGTITHVYPLEKAAELLEQWYAIPVTYEGPIWRWQGDLKVLGKLPNGKEVVVVREHTLVMPEDAAPNRAPTLDATLVAKVIAAYRQQNPDRGRFRVAESRLGFHIVPAEAHDDSGSLAPVTSLLDARVAVPVAQRTAAEHVSALCQAVTAATGIVLKFDDSGAFDKNFAANGFRLPQLLTGAERPYMLFEWGTGETTALEALLDLMDHSSTTMTWRIHCGRPGEGCGMGLYALAVGPNKRQVVFDRCANCQLPPKK
jgi:hypothetical protein